MATDLRIGVDEANRRVGEGRAQFLDVVAPHAWEALDVALPGAIRLEPDQADDRAGELPRDRAFIAYCT